MSDDRTTTRRGLLAAGGLCLTAGCVNSLPLGAGDAQLSAHDLPELDPDEERHPPVRVAVPVDVAPEYVAAHRDRVRGLLATLPTPLGPDEIPNGVVRERLLDAAARATDHLNQARRAETDLLALSRLGRAREEARYAAAGWRFVEDEVAVPDLYSELQTVTTRATDVLASHEYVGDDPVRAAVVHAQIERTLDAATRDDPLGNAEDSVLEAAEVAGAAERTTAHLADGRHLAAQFAASLPDDTGSIEDRLVDAGETLAERVRSKAAEIPPEPSEEADWGPGEHALDDLRLELNPDGRPTDDWRRPGERIAEAHRWLVTFRAIRWINQRRTAGELDTVTSAADVRAVRRAAYDAVETAAAETPALSLSRNPLRDAGYHLLAGDRAVARAPGSGRIDADRLNDAVTEYVIATPLARSIPGTCREVIRALRE
ncbi:hypothetical protein RYH80_15250 [Halobaculum sp. MBLA0147]|uniref:hypothetical protein n=1 Tax=Halobaculum sp. MBLA0147 TaxID=3079934 RepID=UPI00352342E9